MERNGSKRKTKKSYWMKSFLMSVMFVTESLMIINSSKIIDPEFTMSKSAYWLRRKLKPSSV